MNFAAYHLLRHTTCMAVGFLPRRVATVVLDEVILRLAPSIGEPITFTDYQGNEVTL